MSESFETLWTVAHQASLSMAFTRQEYCSALPFPSLGDLPNPGIEPVFLVLADRFLTPEGNLINSIFGTKTTYEIYLLIQ